MDRVLLPSDFTYGPPTGVPEALHRAFVKKEIPERQYFEDTAAWISEHTHQYRPKPYQNQGQVVSAYIQGRMTGLAMPDNANSALLGEWVYSTLRVRGENDLDLGLLQWARDKLREVQSRGTDVSEKIRRLDLACSHFKNLRFPEVIFCHALQVQEKDSRERKRT